MGRYPRAAREAAVKCISCNAPAVGTVSGDYVCVECGRAVVKKARRRGIGTKSVAAQEPADD